MATRAKSRRVAARPVAVRKEWTLKQALAADKRYRARDGRLWDPHRPSAQWFAMHDLDEEEARFKNGERYALAMALRICANHALPLPPWVARAYIDGFDAVHMNRDRSWDVLFGPAILKKGRRNLDDKSGAVWLEVQRLHRAAKPIDDELFAEVGKNLAIGTTLVKKYYRYAKKRHAELLQIIDQPGNPVGELLRPYQARSKK